MPSLWFRQDTGSPDDSLNSKRFGEFCELFVSDHGDAERFTQ
jgi:hypothetical protein